MQTQRCDKCLKQLPLTGSFFDRKQGSGSGFRTVCKSCRKHDRVNELASVGGGRGSKGGLPQVSELIERGDLALVNRFGELMQIGQGTSVPHIAEVYESVMACFGGPAGFAAQLVGTYLAADPGSTIRQRLLGMVAKMSADATASGHATIRLDLLTDDELEEETKNRLVALIKHRPEVVAALLQEHAPRQIKG